jgi:hypothetical protein
VEDVEWERHEEAEKVGDGDPLVSASDAEHLTCNTPCDSQRVELLHILSGPDVCAFHTLEDGVLVLHNGQHHDVVEQSTDDAADGLESESGDWRKLYVLRKLKIAEK